MSRSSASASPVAAAIPFLTCDAAGRFHLQPEAVKILTGIRGKVCPVVVCGPYRTGKSTLLNLLLDRNVKGGSGSFAVGGTVQACTKGVWLWAEPIYVDDCAYIFFDSEGLGSTDQHATFDTQLFSLSLLLASLFVLNTSGTINENALEQLELVVQLTEKIKVEGGASSGGRKSGGGAEGQPHSQAQSYSSLSKFFPSFLWVLRDFTLELRDQQGREITPTAYLEECLRPVPLGERAKKGAAEKNRIRTAISSVFPTRECVTMVRPVAEEKDLQRVSNLSNTALRGEFRNQVSHLKELIPVLAKPKAIDGVFLNGKAFVSLASSYVESINSGSVPTIRSAFASVQEIQGREAVDEAWAGVQRDVKSEIDAKGDTHVWAEEALETLLERIQAQALSIIHHQALGSPEDIAALERNFVTKHIQGLFQSIREKNSHRAERGCSELIESLWVAEGIEDRLPSFESYKQLNDAVTSFWNKFIKTTASMPPRVAQEVGRSFLDKKREGIFKHLYQRLAAAQQEAHKARQANEANQAQVAKLSGELSALKAQADVAQHKAGLELAAANKEGAKLQRDLSDVEKKLRTAESQLHALRAESAEGVKSHATQTSQLQQRVTELTADVKQLQRENAAQQNQLAGAAQLSSAAQASAQQVSALTAQLAAANAATQHEHSKVTKAAADLAKLEAEHNSTNQELLDERDSVNAKLAAAEKELAALRAEMRRNHLAEQDRQSKALQREMASAHTDEEFASIRARALGMIAAEASVVAAEHQRTASNPLGLPPATRTPLVSRASLIPSKFSSAAATPAAAGKRKSAAAPVAEDEDEDMGGGGGDSYDDVQDDDDDDGPAAAAAAAPAARASKPKPAAAAASSTIPASSASSTTKSVPASALRDPNSLTINELKSWLTSLDIEFPQKQQPKAWYVNLAYEKLGDALEREYPRGSKSKKSKS